MKASKREKTKILIELSENVDEADNEVKKFLGDNPSLNEKIAFLRGMFDVEIVGHSYDEMSYYAMLSAIINAKYEA